MSPAADMSEAGCFGGRFCLPIGLSLLALELLPVLSLTNGGTAELGTTTPSRDPTTVLGVSGVLSGRRMEESLSLSSMYLLLGSGGGVDRGRLSTDEPLVRYEASFSLDGTL